MHWLRGSLLGLSLIRRSYSVPLDPTLLVGMATTGSSLTSNLRVLALHGSGGNAQSFHDTITHWHRALQEKKNIELEIVAIDAPVPNEDGTGYSWWRLPKDVRSFQATAYDGFDESSERVIGTISSASEQFDLIIGHSQGGILLASLLALRMLPYHPSRGYVLNGVAWPNPYTQQLEQLQFGTVHGQSPRILLVIGDNDAINAPDQALRVRGALQSAGGTVTSIHHSGGHSVPIKHGESLDDILDWITASDEQAKINSSL